MANLEGPQLHGLLSAFAELDGYDFFILDTSAGISRQVISLCMACSEVILVVTPEPTSLTDAYALLKILSQNGFKESARVLINQCANMAAAKSTYTRFRTAVERYLNMTILPIGVIHQDAKVEEAVKKQQPFMVLYPESIASRGIKNMVQRLIDNQPDNLEPSGLPSFWARWAKFIKAPLILGAQKEDMQAIPAAPHKSEQPSQALESQEYQEKPTSKPSIHTDGSVTPLPEPGERETIPTQAENQESATSKKTGPTSVPSIQLDLSHEMSRLNAEIATVSQELHLLREAIESTGLKWAHVPGLGRERRKAEAHEPIVLDLDAFLERSGLNQKTN
jgi:hypothetical protein